jgi:hypothetical protein
MLRPLADLGGKHDAIALAAAFQPAADDRFRFAALVARHPRRVHVGGVDQVEAVVDEGIEQLEAAFFVRAPAEHVAAEGERCDVQGGTTESALVHGELREAMGL